MFKEKVLKDLQSLTEAKLVKEIILPLLEKMGFEAIEYRHGILEKGIDVLCTKENELLEKDYLAIQIKKLKFSGDATSSNHIYGLSNQLSQCLEEPFKLKNGNIKNANRVWFISPFQLNVIALEVAFQKYVENLKKRIVIIDGDKLYQLICSYYPGLLAKFGDKQVEYIEKFKDETPVLKEAATFGLKEKKYLAHQYVQMHLSPVPDKLINICLGTFEIIFGKVSKKSQHYPATLVEFNSISKILLGVEPVKYESKKVPSFDAGFNARQFLDLIKDRSNAEIESFIASMELPVNESNQKLIELVKYINLVCKIIFSDVFKEIAQVPNKSEHVYYFKISIDQILKSGLNYQIVADAGAGKTTLLRMIGLKEASHFTSRIPVFIPLTNYKGKTTLIDLIKGSCHALGMNLTNDEIFKHLQKGEMLLLLDGIDEVAIKTVEIQEEILKLLEQYKNVQFIFSTRPWSAIPRNDLFATINILPFTKKQVELFFSNWFQDDVEQSKEIIRHLSKNNHLYNVVSTPLVATIIAAIKTHGGKLPKNLIDVYSERLRLLLNDWDSIKGVKRDKFEIEDKRFFLRKLAYEMHLKRVRSVDLEFVYNLTVHVVGNIHSREEANEFVGELINNNNMLFKDDTDKWGFGHLQYQEYLAAVELKENPTIQKAGFLNQGWWSKVLENYAFMTRDISTIILEARSINYELDQFVLSLFNLLTKAPNTDKALKEYIVTLKENNLYDFNFDEEEEKENMIEYDEQLLKILWESKDKKF